MLSASAVHAQDAALFPEAPILRLEDDAHTARVWRIAVDQAERYLVSGSDDKTVRVWDLEAGRLLRVLRVPQGPGNLGKVYAVALSPDGATVAVGGWTGLVARDDAIYLFDREAGRIVRRIAGLPDVVRHLSYSPDGRHLAATLASSYGLRVYETGSYRQVGQDQDYADNAYWADFDARGRLVTSALDGHLRLYDGDYDRPRVKRKAPGGNEPFGVAFSPDGQRLAVGYAESTRVDVLRADTLEPLYVADTTGTNRGLGIVAWSAGGRYLFAAGRYGTGGGHLIRRWADGGRGEHVELEFSGNTVIGLVPLKDGRLAVGATDPLVGVLKPDGALAWRSGRVIADFRDQYGDNAIRLSPAGDVVEFGFEPRGKRRTRFHLQDARLALEPLAPDADLAPPSTEAAGVEVRSWRNRYDPKLNGKPLALEQYEKSRSVAVSEDGERVLLGTEWSLRLFNRDAEPLDRVSAPGIARSVALTRDGNKAVAAFGDGTLRWYAISGAGKLTEVLALFPQRDGRWVAWTPEGFFDAGGGGEALIGYHLNRGADATPDFVGIEQLYDLFYRPDLVAAAFAGDKGALDSALAKIGDVDDVLARGLPPEVQLAGPAEATTQRSEYTLAFTLDDRGGGLERIEYRVNGAVIEPPKGRPTPVRGPAGRPLYRQPLPLAPGTNHLEARAISRTGVVSQPVVAQVEARAPAASARALYGIAIGIDDYRDAVLQLSHAAGDATAFKAALEARGAGLFSQVDITLLTDKAATTVGIEQAFVELAPRVGPEDAFVLYLAGHGRALDGRYHFLPWEFIYETDDTVRNESLDQNKLRRLLETISAQRGLLVFDTCEAGDAVRLAARGGLEEKAAIARLMRATGRAAIAASTSRQQALEGYRGHGVFTYAVLEGLGAVTPDDRGPAAPADRNGDRYIDVEELGRHVFDTVPDITQHLWKREQFPQRQYVGEPFLIGSAPAR